MRRLRLLRKRPLALVEALREPPVFDLVARNQMAEVDGAFRRLAARAEEDIPYFVDGIKTIGETYAQIIDLDARRGVGHSRKVPA